MAFDHYWEVLTIWRYNVLYSLLAGGCYWNGSTAIIVTCVSLFGSQVNLCFDQLVYKLSEQIFNYYKHMATRYHTLYMYTDSMYMYNSVLFTVISVHVHGS